MSAATDAPTAAETTPGADDRLAGIPVPASLRSPVTLVATAALAAGVGVVQPSLAWGVMRAVLVLVLVPCALIDVRHRIIPNRITGPAAVLALALGLGLAPGSEPWTIAWAALAGGFLFVAALAHPGGMGMGDVKLVFVMGLFLGGPVYVALLLALIGNMVVGVGLIPRRGLRGARKTTLPFGPFLAVGGVVAAVAGNGLIDLWLHLPH